MALAGGLYAPGDHFKSTAAIGSSRAGALGRPRRVSPMVAGEGRGENMAGKGRNGEKPGREWVAE